jgi:hypothetical protein
METTQTERANFDTVWATLKEIIQINKETDQINKETAQLMKENERFIKETTESINETKRIVKDNDKRMGELSNRFGEMVEYMVAPNLRAKFEEMGLVFEKVHRNAEIKDRKNNIFAEVDITLENGVNVMIVEVKTKPSLEDITKHIQRIEKVKTHAGFHGDKRKYLGAVAGVVMTEDVKRNVLEQGFYAIEPSGETFNITPPSQPRDS